MVPQYDLRDSESKVQRVRCLGVFRIVSLDIALLGWLSFLDTALRSTNVLTEMWTESSMEIASLTVPRLGRIEVDAVDGFGC